MKIVDQIKWANIHNKQGVNLGCFNGPLVCWGPKNNFTAVYNVVKDDQIQYLLALLRFTSHSPEIKV